MLSETASVSNPLRPHALGCNYTFRRGTLMIDLPSGRIAYAVLSFGGFLGMGEKLFAVPWNALTVDEDQKQIVLNADKEQLKNAPGFDKDDWPDMVNIRWGTQIHTYYGTQPYWESEVQEKTLRGGGGL